MSELFTWVNGNVVELVITSFGLTIVSFVLFMITTLRFTKMSKIYTNLMKGQNGKNLEELLMKNLKLNEDNAQRLDNIERSLARLDAIAEKTVRHIGVVRFNAFNNVGSDQSFSVAMLDNRANGVVFTSLYGRELSQVYAKPIRDGKSSYLLTQEEQEAIEKAMTAK